MRTVRPGEVADADRLGHLHVAAWRAAYAGIIPDEVLASLDPSVRIARWRELLGRPGPARTLVAVDQSVAPGQPVGFVTFGPYRIAQDAAHLDPAAGEIWAINIDPAAWGTGAGHALMTAAVTDLHANGMAEIRLWVLAANARARRFYERFGMRPDGETAAYPVGDRARPTVLEEVRYRLTGPT